MIDSKTSPFSPRRQTPLRVGLIGVTGYGAAYLDALKQLVDSGRVQWGAVTIVNPDQAQEAVAFFGELSVPIYSDYLEMLEQARDLVDWVCIPTAISWHTRMVVESLSRGYQVTVEKPLAPTLQDVAEIQAAERESGIEVSVGFQYAYQKETWDIKKRILAGEIGKVTNVDCLALWPRTQAYYKRNKWSGRLHDGDSWVLDSPLHNALCHLINLILFWSGGVLEKEADLVKMSSEVYRSKPIESYDTVRSVVETASGIEAAVMLSHSTYQRFDPEIRIVGEKGEIVWRFIGDYEVVVGGKSTFYPKLGQIEVRDHMFNSVLDRIEKKDARICTTDLAKGTVKWVNAVHDTAEIHEIPQRDRRAIKEECGDVVDTVENLEYYALRSYKERKTLKEVGASWAVAPSSAVISGYTEFEGCYFPQVGGEGKAKKVAR